jgi:uncharacterized protein YchJ
MEKEKILKMISEAAVPAEMTATLEAMSDDAFWTEAERVEQRLDKGDLTDQTRLYVIAVIREQQRRGALNEERTKALEAEVEKNQKLVAELQRVHDDLQMRVDELSHTAKRPGRNEPCPCGSGKKYKHCCGKN